MNEGPPSIFRRLGTSARRAADSLTTLSADRDSPDTSPAEAIIEAEVVEPDEDAHDQLELVSEPPEVLDCETFLQLPVERAQVARALPLEPAATEMASRRVWPYRRPQGYLGQLSDAAQAELRARFEPLDGQRSFTQRVPTSTGSRRDGRWDFNGNEAALLGHLHLARHRVLELTPGSGHLTWWMEQQGALVVSYDAGLDQRPWNDEVMLELESVQRSWWSTVEDHSLRARAAYGPLEQLPSDVGEFDVAVVPSVLGRVRDPLALLETVSAATTHTVVVMDAEPVPPWNDRELRFTPAASYPGQWWTLTPAVTQRLLTTTGFSQHTITRHTQWLFGAEHASSGPVEVPMYTIVAQRPGPTGPAGHRALPPPGAAATS